MSPIEIIHSDVIPGLKGLASESVQCCITSPPYWGLRNYGLGASVWGGLPNCEHAWGAQERGRRGDVLPSEVSNAGRLGTHANQCGQNDGGRFCAICGAWFGCLGLEPTPELFIAHMVEVFRHVRRVLHKSGTLWLNMGDCYITAPYGDGHTFDPKYGGRNRAGGYPANRGGAQGGLKSKDLVMMPARVALALQSDGWYLRSQIPWLKRNGMPESTADRPASMVEYVYLFSKSEEYFYDAEAAALPQSEHERTRRLLEQERGIDTVYCVKRDDESHGQDKPGASGVAKSVKARQELARKGTRRRRNSDWFFESIEPGFQGMLTDVEGGPVALIVNPQPFGTQMCSDCKAIYGTAAFRKLPKLLGDARVCECGCAKWISHFATFPQKLVAPMILAGTSEHGCCSECGAPWRRVIEKREVGDLHPDQEKKAAGINGNWPKEYSAAVTTGWEPSCSHPLFPPASVPCTVLDPFSGSGRTGIAARDLGRNYIGIDGNADYVLMQKWQFGLLTEKRAS